MEKIRILQKDRLIDFFYKKMTFSILILTIGIPGAGKTKWVTEYKKTHPLTHVISTDDIRLELTGVEQCVDPSQNDMIHGEARKRVKHILNDTTQHHGLGPEIIIDSTNCTVDEWMAYKRLGASIIRAIVFDCEPDQAMIHQQQRERKVPLEIVQMKWDQLQENIHHLPKIFNMIDHIKP